MIGIAARCPCCIAPMSQGERSIRVKRRHLRRARIRLFDPRKRTLFGSNSPSPMGGISSDHVSSRHLLSHASALQRQDNRCWDIPHPRVLAGVKTDHEFRCPAKIVQADPQCGAILLDDHLSRLATTNPHADIVQYRNCGHSIHRMRAFEQRFLGDVQAFVSKVTSGPSSEGP